MKVQLSKYWPEYELIDCGNEKKLERFGNTILIRPDITAKNTPDKTFDSWKNIANAEFIEKKKNQGEWIIYNNLPLEWEMNFIADKIKISPELALSTSKHIGVFPEQVLNWNFIEKIAPKFHQMNFLNLFAYTGLSSIAAAPFSSLVTHIDSMKKIVEIAKQNCKNSGFDNVRCITEDASKFIEREKKREKKYDGIILDPPSIGMGANREKWIFEDMIDDLLSNIKLILNHKSFIIMNLYAHTINDKFAHRLVLSHFKDYNIDFCDKVFGVTQTGNSIDHGYFIRLTRF